MDHMQMSYKDWMFLKKNFETIDRYVISVTLIENDVIIDLYDERVHEFLLDYRSMIVRKGMESEQAYNDAGLRMIRIYKQSIKPYLKEEENHERIY